MSVYVITHKYLTDTINKLGYKYLYVGAYKQKERRDGYCYDDVGDNISIKNNTYCELTGLYWMWKNCKDEYKGLVHYRRFFTSNSLSANIKYFLDEKNCKLSCRDMISSSEKEFISLRIAFTMTMPFIIIKKI